MTIKYTPTIYKFSKRLLGYRGVKLLKNILQLKFEILKYVYKKAILKNFPELQIVTLKFLAEGYSNVIYQVNSSYNFRFPKNKTTASKLNRNVTLLNDLESELPIPLPSICFVSKIKTKSYPYSFVGYKDLSGIPFKVCHEEIRKENWWRLQLAEFLNALHSFPINIASMYGIEYFSFNESPIQKIFETKQSFVKYYERIREEGYQFFNNTERKKISVIFEDFLNEPQNFSFSPVLIHGDFDTTNVLVDPKKKIITGIIDFDNFSIGDPAIDVWEELLPYYNHPNDPTFDRRVSFYKFLRNFQLILDANYNNKQGDLLIGIEVIKSYISHY